MSIILEGNEQYKGCVLGKREINGYSDSDFHAYVWDNDAQTVLAIEYITTRYGCSNSTASIDATPEVQQAYLAWKREQQRHRDYIVSQQPQEGDLVTIDGYKRNPYKQLNGQQGTILAVEKDRYSNLETDYRILIELEDGDRKWIPSDKVFKQGFAAIDLFLAAYHHSIHSIVEFDDSWINTKEMSTNEDTNLEDLTLEQLFLEADRIGQKYQTREEIESFNQELAEIAEIEEAFDFSEMFENPGESESNEYMMGLGEELREYLGVIRDGFSTKEDYIRCCEIALEVLEAELTPEQEQELIENNAGYYGFEFE